MYIYSDESGRHNDAKYYVRSFVFIDSENEEKLNAFFARSLDLMNEQNNSKSREFKYSKAQQKNFIINNFDCPEFRQIHFNFTACFTRKDTFNTQSYSFMRALEVLLYHYNYKRIFPDPNVEKTLQSLRNILSVGFDDVSQNTEVPESHEGRDINISDYKRRQVLRRFEFYFFRKNYELEYFKHCMQIITLAFPRGIEKIYCDGGDEILADILKNEYPDAIEYKKSEESESIQLADIIAGLVRERLELNDSLIENSSDQEKQHAFRNNTMLYNNLFKDKLKIEEKTSASLFEITKHSLIPVPMVSAFMVANHMDRLQGYNVLFENQYLVLNEESRNV